MGWENLQCHNIYLSLNSNSGERLNLIRWRPESHKLNRKSKALKLSETLFQDSILAIETIDCYSSKPGRRQR